jgi:hypothetical protein
MRRTSGRGCRRRSPRLLAAARHFPAHGVAEGAVHADEIEAAPRPGGVARHHLYEASVGPFGVPERRAVVALLAPVSSLPDAVEQMIAAIGGKAARVHGGALRLN